MSNNTLPDKPLRVMGLDIGSKYSAVFFNDYKSAPFKNGKSTQSLVSQNYKEHISFFGNWIRRLKPNLVIYERNLKGAEEFEDRNHSWNTWKIYRTVIGYCQELKIEGIPISPSELKYYRSQQQYMYINEANWIKHKGLTCKIDDLPTTWKEEAEKEGFVWIGEEACNELDAQCLWEYWAYRDWSNDKEWLEARKKLHWQQLVNKPWAIVDRSKQDRRYEDNWYLTKKTNGIKPEQFKEAQKVDAPISQKFGSSKTKIECFKCKKEFYREPKYVLKYKFNLCYDCFKTKK